MKILFTILFICLFAEAFSATYYDRLLARGKGNYWLQLIHYTENNFFRSKSRVDNKGFFFSPDRARDPEKELDATIMAFQKGEPLVWASKLHPQCAFPERLKTIRELNIATVKPVKCKAFASWKKKYNPKNISLIFYNSNNGNVSDLLGDVVIKVTAYDNQEYIFFWEMVAKGNNYYILGGPKKFLGFNSTKLKVLTFKAYFKSHSYRDFFEYKLNFSNKELGNIINHIWEMNQEEMYDYYQVWKNLAFLTADLLQVGREEFDLLKRNKFYYTARDLVNNLGINEQNKSSFHSPDKSHDNQQVNSFLVLEENQPAFGIGYKAGYHGILSSNQGYVSNSSFDFLTLKFIYDYDVKKFKVPEFSFFNFILLRPVTESSWSLSTKGAIEKDYASDIALSFKSRLRAYYGVGLNFNFLGHWALFTGLEYQRSNFYKKHNRIGPWAEWMLFFNLFRQGKILLRQKIFVSLLESLSNGYFLENEASFSLPVGHNKELFFKNKLTTKTGGFHLGQYKIELGYGVYF